MGRIVSDVGGRGVAMLIAAGKGLKWMIIIVTILMFVTALIGKSVKADEATREARLGEQDRSLSSSSASATTDPVQIELMRMIREVEADIRALERVPGGDLECKTWKNERGNYESICTNDLLRSVGITLPDDEDEDEEEEEEHEHSAPYAGSYR